MTFQFHSRRCCAFGVVCLLAAGAHASLWAKNPKVNFTGNWIYSNGKGTEVRMILGSKNQFMSANRYGKEQGTYIRKGRYFTKGNMVFISYPLSRFDLPFAHNEYYVGTMVDRFSMQSGRLSYLSSILYFKSKDDLQKGMISRRVDRNVKFLRGRQVEGNRFLRPLMPKPPLRQPNFDSTKTI